MSMIGLPACPPQLKERPGEYVYFEFQHQGKPLAVCGLRREEGEAEVFLKTFDQVMTVAEVREFKRCARQLQDYARSLGCHSMFSITTIDDEKFEKFTRFFGYTNFVKFGQMEL